MTKIRDTTNKEIKDFFDGWNLYKQFVDNNWMFHQEMYNDLENELNLFFNDKSISILDLGCGDAACIAKVLAKKKITTYTGVDLSQIALDLADINLQSVTQNKYFVSGDFIQQMHKLSGQNFDLIFTGYALHHYTNIEKQEFFKLAKNLLKPCGGMLAIIDLICQEGQTSKEAVTGLLNYYKSINDIPPEVLSMASQHVSNNDIPESISTYHKMAEIAGFAAFKNGNKKEYFQLFTCTT